MEQHALSFAGERLIVISNECDAFKRAIKALMKDGGGANGRDCPMEEFPGGSQPGWRASHLYAPAWTDDIDNRRQNDGRT